MNLKLSFLETKFNLVIATDLDHTLVAHDEDPSNSFLLQFNETFRDRLALSTGLIYSTGRSLEKFRQLEKAKPLINPDLLICSVGTEVYRCPIPNGCCCPDPAWSAFLQEGWDRDKVLSCISALDSEGCLSLQDASEQRPFKVSYICTMDRDKGTKFASTLESALIGKGLRVQVVYSGGRDLDVIPARAGKGNALKWILERMEDHGVRPPHVLVCGDSGNDQALFLVPAVKGCVVGNAMPELRDFVAAYRGGRYRPSEGPPEACPALDSMDGHDGPMARDGSGGCGNGYENGTGNGGAPNGEEDGEVDGADESKRRGKGDPPSESNGLGKSGSESNGKVGGKSDGRDGLDGGNRDGPLREGLNEIYEAREVCAGGILEALRHFGWLGAGGEGVEGEGKCEEAVREL